MGWSTTKGGNVKYADGALFTMGKSNVTLYDVWKIGFITQIEPQKLIENILAKKVTNPKRTNYKFVGWNTQAERKGIKRDLSKIKCQQTMLSYMLNGQGNKGNN